MEETEIISRRADGTPVYAFRPVPGVQPVGVIRLLGLEPPAGHAHAHNFLVLGYFERGGGSIQVNERMWPVEAGDAYIIAPGEVISVGDELLGLKESEGWAASFTQGVFGSESSPAFLSWRTHPLLFPFVRGASGGIQRLKVPEDLRPQWSERFRELELELRQRQDGYQEAVLAHLTLLLVSLSRLAANVVADLKLNDEPLLAEVFSVIEERYHEPVSLRDVAWAVNLTPGYLTTIVRQKTGRTVQEWLTERRMAQARRLLAETDLAIEEVGRNVGFGDPGYFVRSFRRAHELTPRAWRQAGRPSV